MNEYLGRGLAEEPPRPLRADRGEQRARRERRRAPAAARVAARVRPRGRVVRARNSLRAQDETAYSFLSQEPARKIYSREGRASFVSDEERSRLKEGLCHQQPR